MIKTIIFSSIEHVQPITMLKTANEPGSSVTAVVLEGNRPFFGNKFANELRGIANLIDRGEIQGKNLLILVEDE